MTTLLVSEIFPPKVGGSGRWFSEIYSRLPTGNYRVAAGADPAAARVDAALPLPIDRIELSFPTRYIRRASLPYYRRAVDQLSEIVQTHAVSSLHCARAVPEGLLGWWLGRRFDLPFSCYAHGEEVNPSNPEHRPGRFSRRIYGSRELGLMVGKVLASAQYMIANSRNTERILTERWRLDATKVSRLYPGVDCQRYTPAPRSEPLRRELGWSNRKVVLTVGRLQLRKGHDVLLDAVHSLRDRHPDLLAVLIGQGEEEENLRRRVDELGLENQVQLLTGVDDQTLIDCYQQSDLFVLPNRAVGGDIEGFGIVLLEAQACGLPVIAGDSGGTAETMIPNETGFIVPCETAAPLATQIDHLLSHPERCATIGHAGRSWVEQTFDWSNLAKEAAALFQSRRVV